MVHADITVVAPAATKTHTEPTDSVTASVNSGQVYSHGFGPYVNTGNVPQTLTVSVDNLTGGTLDSITLRDNTSGDNLTGTTVTLEPDQTVSATVVVTAETLPTGSLPGTLSFDVTDTWS